MIKITPVNMSRSHAEAGYAPREEDGRPLSSLMRDTPGVVQELLPVMVDVLNGVEQAQRIHDRQSNLDPREILLRKDGSVELTSRPQPSVDKTSAFGSVKYSSPELFQDDGQANVAASNSYVLGFVFYELLLGHELFNEQFKQVRQSGDAGWLIWHADKKSRAVPASDLLANFPSFISQTIEKMMAKNPPERMTDLNAIAHIFGRACHSTAAFKVVKDSAIDSGSMLASTERDPFLRPWLVRLAKQSAWKSLWRRVTPDEPRPGWESIQELERMFRSAREMVRRVGLTFTFKFAKKRTRGQNLPRVQRGAIFKR